MKKLTKLLFSGVAIVVTVLFIIGSIAGTCAFNWSNTEERFDTIKLGDTEKTVLDKMKQPSHIELPGNIFIRYADKGCEGSCVQRWWYEHRVCMDLEAWSVSFDKNGKVMEKYNWVSP